MPSERVAYCLFCGKTGCCERNRLKLERDTSTSLIRLCAFAPVQDRFDQFAQVLSGCCEKELVVCATWLSQSKPSQPDDAIKVRKVHLDVHLQLH